MDLYLIDGNSYVYRAFYAIKELTSSRGLPTNAIYGFTNMLLKILREKKPDGIAVSFDTAAPTERHRIYEQYKAHRPETPPALLEQMPHIRKVISAFNIKTFEAPGYEADDLIGTVARRAAAEGASVFIVTSDKDMLQLVDSNIKIYDPVKDRVLDAEYVKERFGVGPERVTEFMALTGDAVDNIPGVKGIGEKTARELLLSFESLEDMLEHTGKIKREKLRQMIQSSRDIILLSRRLAAIDTSAPVEIDMKEFTLKDPDWLSLLSLFKEFEFSTLLKLIPSQETSERRYEMVVSLHRLREILSAVKNDVSIDLEATGRNALADSIVGVALCHEKDRAFYIPLGHARPQAIAQMEREEAARELEPIMANEGIAKIGHNLKYDITLLWREGIGVRGRLFDTMIASYLLNPNRPNHGLDEVALEYLSKRKKAFVEVLGKRASFADVPVEEATTYAAEDAALSFELKDILFGKLRESGQESLYFEIEMPLIHVLMEMEKSGVGIDAVLLSDLSKEMEVEIESVRKRIHFMAGEEFNVNSPKQLSEILFRSLGLSPTKRTKTGFSTDMDVLEELAESHDLPREVLQYRSLTKLKTTYIDVLPSLINPKTGRVHTSFNQTVAATGRLSSSDPNLQNIPIRGEWGKRIRQAFIAAPGNLLLSADYSQVELRVLAHMSGDEGLIEAFTGDIDVHTRTASELYGVPMEGVTAAMRRTAKTVNFGVIYGISSFGLAEALNIGREDARNYIERYFERHPGVRKFTEKTVREAEAKGYVTTLLGRRRPVPELRSRNRNIRQQGERLAVNSPVQGTAADIIKIAMINISKRIKRDPLKALMILQVHDELLFEMPESELEALRGIVKEEMERALPLSVPLKVEIGAGKNWDEAH